MIQLQLKPGLCVVDGTIGAGGHSQRIQEQIGESGHLIGVDRDEMMLGFAAEVVAGDNVTLVQSSYHELERILGEHSLESVDRILVDLGLSSDQLSHDDRGFGFQTEGELDMRFDRRSGQPAWELIADSSRNELSEIFADYGEEPHAEAIAAEIVQQQKNSPIKTVRDLNEAVLAALPKQVVNSSRNNPATRVFQALRIAVNRELEHLETALRETFPRCLKPGGILVVITFHSLEDRLVKRAFQDKTIWENLTPKPVVPGANEQKMNPRSRSAKIRSARRTSQNSRRSMT